MATFNVKVVTYQEKVLEQEADFLLVRTTEGIWEFYLTTHHL